MYIATVGSQHHRWGTVVSETSDIRMALDVIGACPALLPCNIRSATAIAQDTCLKSYARGSERQKKTVGPRGWVRLVGGPSLERKSSSSSCSDLAVAEAVAGRWHSSYWLNHETKLPPPLEEII